jgi:hypothetical protein
MKCWICQHLKREQRINVRREAVVIVHGMSLCEHHSTHLFIIRSDPFIAVDTARTQLIMWWDDAIHFHGKWDMDKGKFEDGSILPDYYWESTAKILPTSRP